MERIEHLTGIGALIVDDNEDIRTILRYIIEGENEGLFVVGEAEDGPDALARVDDLDPAVVIIDQMMPGMTGLECAAQIKAKRPWQLIVICTAYLDERLRTAAKELGITVVLSKTQMFEVPKAVRRLAAEMV